MSAPSTNTPAAAAAAAGAAAAPKEETMLDRLNDSSRAFLRAYSQRLLDVADGPAPFGLLSAPDHESQPRLPQLLLVAKCQTLDSLREAHALGQVNFGENYIPELCNKALLLPKTIQWHYIGILQSNKIRHLLQSVPNLAGIQTVTSERQAQTISRVMGELKASGVRAPGDRLRLFVQINTSGEDTKSGLDAASVDTAPATSETDQTHPDFAVMRLIRQIQALDHVAFEGLMTIGSTEESYADSGYNSDFARLHALRERICTTTGLHQGIIGLSMGMSADFEQAIRQGSTCVRIGSAIFGGRNMEAVQQIALQAEEFRKQQASSS
ncbi:YggS family pyridoxal phosphate enzyme [Fonticula alba]|uniref:Pyridoxal phosphate homeostasis protein n=1 Tax=Fonticula alba TaxID=691883 RepID=A0A058Z4S3_FONAL|nr:YggS family pyridoxal phosphate enzyme [Fonticula alba]KCV68923.1 YggS family pyridoxal phosphate enzyme [Fonticula alba]|eukprot:XP_009496494.1 YggS family pyridoxal phosphate enzyme [Fonticula alba]